MRRKYKRKLNRKYKRGVNRKFKEEVLLETPLRHWTVLVNFGINLLVENETEKKLCSG